jgi:hypothetical protein
MDKQEAQSKAIHAKASEHPVHALVKAFRDTGRVAYHFPKKQMYSLNGGKNRNYDEAHQYMKEVLDKK